MNGTEQRAHTKVTDVLDDRLRNVEEVLAALDDRVSHSAVLFQRSIGEERTHRLKLADEQRAYVDREDQQLRRTLAWTALRTPVREHTTIGQRLRWLIRGD